MFDGGGTGLREDAWVGGGKMNFDLMIRSTSGVSGANPGPTNREIALLAMLCWA